MERLPRSLCCAACPCGTAEIDCIELKDKECNSCDHLLRYCNVACQEDHTLQHEQEYMSRAAVIISDDILYRQPESSHILSVY
eukprot:scaffold31570_cov94-Skeletonema_dohrnii-CCMP3373.AAC.1